VGVTRESFLELFAERHGEGSDRIWCIRWMLLTTVALQRVEDGFPEGLGESLFLRKGQTDRDLCHGAGLGGGWDGEGDLP
jgi:hypothetical protein